MYRTKYAITDEVKLLNENMTLAHITINNIKEISDVKLLEIIRKINESFKSYKNFIDSDFVQLFRLALEENSYHDTKVWTLDKDMKLYPKDQFEILETILKKFGLKIMTSNISGGYNVKPMTYEECARISITFHGENENHQIHVELEKVIICNKHVDVMTPPIYETDINL